MHKTVEFTGGLMKAVQALWEQETKSRNNPALKLSQMVNPMPVIAVRLDKILDIQEFDWFGTKEPLPMLTMEYGVQYLAVSGPTYDELLRAINDERIVTP